MKTKIMLSVVGSFVVMAGARLSAAEANGGETIEPAAGSTYLPE